MQLSFWSEIYFPAADGLLRTITNKDYSVPFFHTELFRQRIDDEGILWSSKSSLFFLRFKWYTSEEWNLGDRVLGIFHFCIFVLFISTSMYYINNEEKHETIKDS